MISVVNGFVCTSSCDVSKAKQGKDPSAPPGATVADSSQTKTSGLRANDPAVILDGALKDAASADAVTPAQNATASQPLVNKLI